MQSVTTIGLDIAKSVFQVHGVDAAGQVIIRRQLKRRYMLAFFQKLPPCLVGIEACASSHHWSRELHALGHSVRLMPPAYVKPEGQGRLALNGHAIAAGECPLLVSAKADITKPFHQPLEPLRCPLCEAGGRHASAGISRCTRECSGGMAACRASATRHQDPTHRSAVAQPTRHFRVLTAGLERAWLYRGPEY